MNISDPATHTDHEIGAEAVIARQNAEIERLRAVLAMARTLILSAPLHMPTWPGGEALNSWTRDANKWLDANGPEAPGHTDLMVTPESLDEYLEKNPPPDTVVPSTDDRE